MARLGRRQPFAPIIKRLILFQAAAPTPPVAAKPMVLSLVAIGAARRPRTSIVSKTLIQFQPAAAAPVASKPLVVSFAAIKAARRPKHSVIFNRLTRFPPVLPVAAKPFIVNFVAIKTKPPKIFRPTIRRVIQYAAPASTPPAARFPYIVSRQSVDTASRRYHALRHPLTGRPPQVTPAPARVLPKFFVDHDEAIVSRRSRRHEQQVAQILNGMVFSGELVGTIEEPQLGYVPNNTASWNGASPATISEALSRIAALLKTLNGGIGP